MAFRCQHPGCQFQAAAEDQLGNHASSNHGDDPLACRYCGLRLGDASSLARHTDKHKNPAKHKCMVCPKSYHRVDSLASHIHKLHFQDIWQFARAHGYIPLGNQPALAVNQPAPVNQLAPPMHQPAIANQFDPRMQQVAPPNFFPHAMHPTAPYDLATLQVAPADHSAPAMHHGTPMSLFAPGFLQPAAPMNEPMPMANQQPAPLLYQAAPVDDPQAANQQNTAEHQYPDPAN